MAEQPLSRIPFIEEAPLSVDPSWSIRQCADAPPPPALSRRGPEAGDASDWVAAGSLDAATVAGLQAQAKRFDVTLPQLVCSVWIAVLSRLSHQGDILIGLAVASRRAAAPSPNLVPLRIAVSPGASLAGFVQDVARGTRDAFRHRNVPYATLRQALGLQAGDSGPLSVTFSFGSRLAPSLPILDAELGFAVAYAAEAGLALRLTTSGRTYTQAETEGLLRRVTIALTRLGGDDPAGEPAVADLELMDAQELRTVRDVFSSGPPASAESTLAALFGAQVARTPEAVALLAGREQLTYAELDAESNKLAREIIALGFGPGDVAALLLPRASRLIAALLACVKTGIAYCPLDPTNPGERLDYMIAASGSKFVIRDLTGPLDVGRDLATLYVDDPRVAASIAKRSGEPLAESECGRRSPCDLAYIIFTSGSTGRPKGVAVSNRAIAQQVQAVTREVPMEPGEAALGIFTIAFDVATLDIFLTLSQGASFVLLDEQEFRDPELIVRSAIRNRAVTMNATPTLWRTLNVDLLPPGVVAMCGGEQFPADLLPRLSRLRRVINLYGPTETAVTATLQRVTEADVQDGIIPVGRPLAGYRVWVLDADNRPVPVGAIGELWIGGAGLAEGYAGDPGLTAERFIACPFAPGRMYRTGDLARWRADGAVEILGRSDAQVKIHGHRIELGEIEQAIRALPWAADAAVVPVGSGSTMRLTAYVVAKPGHTAPDSAGLRSALAERLPEVMRPSACMALEALPRTPSGKLDRGNLPALVEESPIHDYRPPGSAEEALLRLGFARVTGRTRVAGDDDFFEIGGDSLRAMILVSEMRQAGFSLPMQLLFSARSPAAIAESWRGANTKRSVPDMRPLVFMLPGAGGDHPGLAKLRANCSDAVQFVPLEYPDWPTFAGPDASMDDAAAELAARIESIAPTGPICLAGYSFGAYVAWRIAEMFVEKGRIVRGLILLDADAWVRNPPDAPRDPFFTRLNRFVRMRLQSWRDGELSQGLAENLSWHLTHGRGITVLRSLRHVRMLPLPQAFRTWLRFYVSRELHARVVIPWYPGWCDGRPVTALYPVILLRAEEPVRDRAEDLGWGRYFLDLRITEVTGDHLTMLDRSGPRSLQERLPAAVAMLHLNAAQQPGETIPV